MKRHCDSEEDENDTEIFSYNNKRQLTFKNDLVVLSSSDSNSSSDSANESESEEEKIEKNDSSHIIDTVVEKPHKKRIMLSPPSPPPPPTAANHVQSKKVHTIHLLSQLQEDKDFSPLNTSNRSFLVSDDEDMKKRLLKVRLHGLIKKFEVKPDERLEKVLEEIAKQEGVRASNVILTFKNQNILPSDTILKLNLSVADILECFTHTEMVDFTEPNDQISVVLQSSGRHKSKFTANKHMKLEDLLDKYCHQNGLDKHTVSLSVDGDELDCSKTPLELEIFDEDVLDVHIAEHIAE